METSRSTDHRRPNLFAVSAKTGQTASRRVSTQTQTFDLLIHATHEAGVKMGGIGAVLNGLLSTAAYKAHVERSILVGTMNTEDREFMDRLLSPRNRLTIHYSRVHHISETAATLAQQLEAVEQLHGVKLLYGVRAFGDMEHEVILVDARHAKVDRLNRYKAGLYGHFGIQSHRYEGEDEYRQYIHAAEAQYQALQAVTGQAPGIIVAHEFMGMPLCYSARMHAPERYRTVFYGHEVTSVRPIIESHPGHDTMFYNVLACAQREGLYLEDVFGDQSHFFKHALIQPVPRHCDNILAVGDWVLREMQFLGPDWHHSNIDLVYNGVPSIDITPEAKSAARERLQQYCENLLSYRPDHILTHVTRFIPSKGMWRDLWVVQELAPLLSKAGKRAVLFCLSTVIPVGRSPAAIHRMEAQYGWPVYHSDQPTYVEGHAVPDLVSHEIPFYRAIESFNRTSSGTAIVLVNQFGWSRDRCGSRMPKDMSFLDIRHGTDLEFGQSIYEPFGIAQVEPLGSGALCVVSNACGCVGFLQRVGALDTPNIVLGDYTRAGNLGQRLDTALSIAQTQRDAVEKAEARSLANRIMERLPNNNEERKKLLEQGRTLSKRMSWQVVVDDYLLPALARAQAN